MKDQMFIKGGTYKTLRGNEVTIMEFSNENTTYETVKGCDGKHRYNRRDYGRCTGGPLNNPNNLVKVYRYVS